VSGGFHRDAQGRVIADSEYVTRRLEDIGPRRDGDERPDPSTDPLHAIRDQRLDADRIEAPPEGRVAEAMLKLREYVRDNPELVPGHDGDWR
jgi:hypothetical protein